MDSLTERIEHLEESLTARMGGSLSDSARQFIQSYAEAPDPSAALTRIERFFDALGEEETILPLLESDIARRVLAAITWNSAHLSNLLVHHPSWLDWLVNEARLDTALYRRDYQQELSEQETTSTETPARLAELRRFKSRHSLRIAVRELCDMAGIEITAMELSHLAESCIDAVTCWARQDLMAQYGEPQSSEGRTASLVVVGMGKLGGEELNFSSDVDLLFAYDEEGTTSGGPAGKLDNFEFFNKQATRIVSELEATTPDGFLYRVDMRLRPEGRAGALVASIGAYEFYYETRGGAWERQALLRARAIGGDLEVGKRFLDNIRPFTFRKYIDEFAVQDTLRSVHNLRKKMLTRYASNADAVRDVKNGPGGLRDVEFILQTIQILYGGQYPEIRVTNSLQTLKRIYESGLLRTEDYQTFRPAYLFLRRLEHRLQMLDQLQTFMLPDNEQELARFARSLGYYGVEDFREDHTRHTQAVRRIYNAVFVDEELEDQTEMVLDGQNSQGLKYLETKGFDEPARARRLIQSMAVCQEAPHLAGKMRRLLGGFLPRLIDRLAASPAPDMGLLNIARIMESSGVPTELYRTLGDSPQMIDLLVALGSGSRYLSDVVAQDPSVLDVLVDPEFLQGRSSRANLATLYQSLRTADPERPHVEVLRRLRDVITLRAGLCFLLDLCNIREATRGNSIVAEFIVNEVFQDQYQLHRDRYGSPAGTDPEDSGYAIIGLGKLGGRELNFGSDLDLLFIYEGEEAARETSGGTSGTVTIAEFWTRVSTGLLNILGGRSRGTAIYEADARLRPFGRNAPLCASLPACKRYYQSESQVWERLALTRARFICGDIRAGRQFDQIIDEHIIRPALTEENRREIRSIRERMEDARGDETLKAGPGGIVDVEFLAQTLMLGQDPGLRRTNTWQALDALETNGSLQPDESAQLRDGFTFLREVETRLRLVDNVSVDRLPEGEEELETLVARMYPASHARKVTVREFLDTMRHHTKRIREIFLSHFHDN